MKTNVQLKKQIKDNRFTMNCLLIAFLAMVGLIFFRKGDLQELRFYTIIVFILMTNLNTSRKINEHILEMRETGEYNG